jgi:hypothetical protein
MIIQEFRFASTDDKYDIDKYTDKYAWSRPYEYKFVSDYLDNVLPKNSKIHNSSWGFAPLHQQFRNELDKNYNCLHSDIRTTDGFETYIYDVRKRDDNLVEFFDAVINVSTLEEVHGHNKDEIVFKSLENLYEQVKSGGYLICTFDYPTVNLEAFEENLRQYTQATCQRVENALNGNNSVVKNSHCANLNIIFLIIKKD